LTPKHYQTESDEEDRRPSRAMDIHETQNQINQSYDKKIK